jgi:4-carboxymuconolactone decarboxylase
VSDATYSAALSQFGERGLVDLIGVLGYFSAVSMALNVAHTPPPADTRVTPLAPLPL